jgi:hypothetical protein
MTPPDILFSRVIIASLMAFAVLAAVYFRLPRLRVASAIVRLLPIVGVASMGAAIVFDLPLVAKVLFGLLGATSLSACLLGLIVTQRFRSLLKGKPKT